MNKEIKVSHFIIVLFLLMCLECFLVCYFLRGKKDINIDMCKKAICNEDKTICYVYELDEDKQIPTWKGSCK